MEETGQMTKVEELNEESRCEQVGWNREWAEVGNRQVVAKNGPRRRV
jgi:hypothetical protein